MLTVPQLEDYDASQWTNAADGFAKTQSNLRSTGDALNLRATMLLANWFDPIGQMIGERMKGHADKYSAEANKLFGIPSTLRISSTAIEGCQKTVGGWVSWARRYPYTVEDNGSITVRWDEVGDNKVVRWFHRTNAPMASGHIRQGLWAASVADALAAAAIARARNANVTWPPGFDGGPIDMSDQGIRDSLLINEQDDYGDCVLLAGILALGVTDPEWVRRHVKWNDDTQTYTVTIYDRDGNPVNVEVDPRNLPEAGAQDSSNNRRPTLASIIEEAIRTQYPTDTEDGFRYDDAFRALTGQPGNSSNASAPTIEDVEAALNGQPPGAVVAGGFQQPWDVPEEKSLVPNHAYSVSRIDEDGNYVLRNPWGPDGGWWSPNSTVEPKFFPGEVTITPEEFQRWCRRGGIVEPPF